MIYKSVSIIKMLCLCFSRSFPLLWESLRNFHWLTTSLQKFCELDKSKLTSFSCHSFLLLYVYTGDYGVPKPWYFPFMKSYWFPAKYRIRSIGTHGNNDTQVYIALSQQVFELLFISLKISEQLSIACSVLHCKICIWAM